MEKSSSLQKKRAKSDGKTKRRRKKNLLQDTIEAARKRVEQAKHAGRTQRAEQTPLDNYDERIDVQEYKKLVAWIKEKERFRREEPG